MTVAELADFVAEQLGGNHELYPRADIILNGLNPAIRLLCILQPALYTVRALVSMVAEQAFIDLRDLPQGIVTPSRLVLGDVRTQDVALPASGVVQRLDRAVLSQVMTRRAWWRTTGVPRWWYRLGAYLIGVFPRPVYANTVTVIGSGYPVLDVDELEAEVPLSEGIQPLIADIAMPYLLLREGGEKTQNAVSRLQELLTQEGLVGAA